MKAFPQLAHWEINERNGMDLRDYFAAKAMQGLITGAEDYSEKRIAQLAYELADAMIKVRKEQKE